MYLTIDKQGMITIFFFKILCTYVIRYQQACEVLRNKPAKAVKEAMVEKGVGMLASYRKNCASASSPGQLILPEALKLMPVYMNAMLKSDMFRTGVFLVLALALIIHPSPKKCKCAALVVLILNPFYLCICLSGADVRVDARSETLFAMKAMPVHLSVPFFYPRMMCVSGYVDEVYIYATLNLHDFPQEPFQLYSHTLSFLSKYHIGSTITASTMYSSII